LKPTPRETEAAVLTELGKPLRILSLAIPELKAGQVLVEVAYSGLCQSQLLEIRGKRGPDRFLPHTLGHEGAGTVREVGPGVSKVKPGDRVILSWIAGGGAQVGSTVYQSAEGPVNSGPISTFLRRTVTCESRLTPIPPDLPLREAALLGCAVLTGAGAVLNTARPRPGESLAVFGVGGIGLSAVLGAVVAQASPIVAVDVADHKLELAGRVGATHLVHAGRTDPLAALSEITGGRGLDFAIESAGRRETMEAAFQSVRAGGGLCILAGNLPEGERITINPFDLIRGKRIAGTWGGESSPERDIPRYLDLWSSGRMPIERLISHQYPLSEINRAFADLEEGRVARALLDLTGGGEG
jgi:S-(hydroxymethyl)glutathione dehydrogenase/alcohol dehydrogenase